MTTVDQATALADRLIAGDRAALARAITLVESASDRDRDASEALLARVLPRSGDARRVAISGPPGVGKSTLIEALGTRFIDRGDRVAVLAIDPSSAITGGSILADKTRMPRLSADPRAFVRPSPTSATLGGVARATRDTISVVEAAGYGVILVETVGVGQSETEAHAMVDTFVLLVLPNSGDELQGMKRGIVELAHIVVVNKADGDLERAAAAQAREYANARKTLAAFRATAGQDSQVLCVSALHGAGVTELVAAIDAHRGALEASGALARTRAWQGVHALRSHLEHEAIRAFFRDPRVQAGLPAEGDAVGRGEITASGAARRLAEAVFDHQTASTEALERSREAKETG